MYISIFVGDDTIALFKVTKTDLVFVDKTSPVFVDGEYTTKAIEILNKQSIKGFPKFSESLEGCKPYLTRSFYRDYQSTTKNRRYNISEKLVEKLVKKYCPEIIFKQKSSENELVEFIQQLQDNLSKE